MVSSFDDIKNQITSIKSAIKSKNSDYLTGYICALSAIEEMLIELEDNKKLIECEDAISRQAAIDYFFRPYSNEELYCNIDIKNILKKLPSIKQEKSIAEERYEDLCDYFGEAKDILNNREEFKRWLERIKWHIRKAEELYKVIEDIKAELHDAIFRYTVSKERQGEGKVEWSDYLLNAEEVFNIIYKYTSGAKVVQNGMYQRGLGDAWECASNIVFNRGNVRDIIGDFSLEKIFDDFSASEVIAKIKEFEDKRTSDEKMEGEE